MTGRERIARAGRRALVVGTYILPLLLIAHAVAFWGHGIIDREATSFVLNYLADRPFVAAIFDPRLNDWGLYQARELSYVFDYLDARVFAALLDRHVLLFVPVSGVIGLLALAAIYFRGARRVLRIDGVTASLLLSLFLSGMVTQASTAILYRSSKIVLSVALLAFLFHVASLLMRSDRRASAWDLTGLFWLGIVMSVVDRQGFFYLIVVATIVTALWATTALRGARSGSTHLRVVAACLGAIGAAALYNLVIAPRVIHAVNGYWPDFSYQELPIRDFFSLTLASQSWTMFRAQTSYFFGNVPFLVVGVAAAGAAIWSSVRARSIDPVLLVVAGAASLVALLAVMILRHPPVFSIPDHSFWYYTLTLHVVLLFGVSLWLARSGGVVGLWPRSAFYLLLCLMMANNIRHYPEQRAIMINSGGWFRNSTRAPCVSRTTSTPSKVAHRRVRVRRPRGCTSSLPAWSSICRLGSRVSSKACRPRTPRSGRDRRSWTPAGPIGFRSAGFSCAEPHR